MVVPNGNTVIQQGDILVVSDQSHIEEKKKKDAKIKLWLAIWGSVATLISLIQALLGC